jgi:hypothetical protein
MFALTSKMSFYAQHLNINLKICMIDIMLPIFQTHYEDLIYLIPRNCLQHWKLSTLNIQAIVANSSTLD